MQITPNTTIKAIASDLGIDRDKAKRIRDLITGKIDYRSHPAVIAWAEKCYHDPRQNRNTRGECVLEAINAEIGGYGQEAIHGRYVDHYHQDIQAGYVNMGDAYAATVLQDCETDRFYLTSWGDWVERHERSRRLQ